MFCLECRKIIIIYSKVKNIVKKILDQWKDIYNYKIHHIFQNFIELMLWQTLANSDTDPEKKY